MSATSAAPPRSRRQSGARLRPARHRPGCRPMPAPARPRCWSSASLRLLLAGSRPEVNSLPDLHQDGGGGDAEPPAQGARRLGDDPDRGLAREARERSWARRRRTRIFAPRGACSRTRWKPEAGSRSTPSTASASGCCSAFRSSPHVTPHFAVLDERGQAELRRAAFDATMARAAENSDSALGQALAKIIARHQRGLFPQSRRCRARQARRARAA